jgi:plasmid stabilization system protein ParE
MKCSLTALARLDLRELYLYVANESVDRADALRAEIEAATDHIAAMPRIGHTRPDLTSAPSCSGPFTTTTSSIGRTPIHPAFSAS